MIYTCPFPFFPPFLLTDYISLDSALQTHTSISRSPTQATKKSRKRTLHPSQSFFTELLTFIPLTCSIATSAVFTTTAAVGLVVAAAVFANATDESALVAVGATHFVKHTEGRSALRAERRRRGSIVGLV